MLDRAIATQHAEIALAKSTQTRTARNLRNRLRIFKGRWLRLLRILGEFFSAGGPLS
jgi:hypothetical protein